jgi:prophage antirepressor-like protein
MDIIKAFKLNEQEIKVNIQGTQDEPLFQANQIGKILDIKKIRNSIQNFNEDEKSAYTTSTLGGEQKCLFLTEKGLYRLLGQSRKPIAKIFQGWMVNVIQEIRINGIYQLKQENEVDRQLLQNKHKKDIHNILIEKNQYKNVVYIVQFEDETYEKENKILIKIGNTQSIKERIQHLQCDFNKNINLIDIYECINHVKFERFLHNNEYIKNFNHKIKTTKDIDSKEIYLINTDVLKDFKNIIQENIEKFNDSSLINRDIHLKLQEKELVLIEKEMEIQKAQHEYNLKMQEMQLELEKIKNDNLDCRKNYQEEVNEECGNNDLLILEEYEASKGNTYGINYNHRKNGVRIPKVYKYDPKDLEKPLQDFDSPKEVINNYPDISISALKRASQNNYIYKDYRWIFLVRTDTLPDVIPDTISCKHQSPLIKYIAMIDIKQESILAVYASQKEACEARNLKSRSFTRAIQQNSISSGHYWNFFDNCSDEMKLKYLKHNKLPEKNKPNSEYHIHQIDMFNDEKIINTYYSKTDIVQKFQMSHNTLNKALKENKVVHGHKWKLIMDIIKI